MKTLSLTLFLSFMLFSCSEQKDPKLIEAAKLHNEATAIQATLEVQVEGIDSLISILNDKKKTIKNAGVIAHIDSVAAALGTVSKNMEDWEANLIEVPGMPHAENAGEHHHHEHKKAPDMSAEQMLQVQQEIKKGIEKIRDDLAKAEAMMQGVL